MTQIYKGLKFLTITMTNLNSFVLPMHRRQVQTVQIFSHKCANLNIKCYPSSYKFLQKIRLLDYLVRMKNVKNTFKSARTNINTTHAQSQMYTKV